MHELKVILSVGASFPLFPFIEKTVSSASIKAVRRYADESNATQR